MVPLDIHSKHIIISDSDYEVTFIASDRPGTFQSQSRHPHIIPYHSRIQCIISSPAPSIMTGHPMPHVVKESSERDILIWAIYSRRPFRRYRRGVCLSRCAS
ncbi:hypothetical protein CEXT_768541 [Caerostris extrusa]|uniref:Uncharacterized protein n=1 Tax=Caerostris extrusa TaxID=172846 RepID=A0AAV4REC7_CAEEX|nr:hypothetical protein CEXT_768541 [Caerostris extrusa]